MALLSLEKIREIQNVAELYAARERERLVRADAAAVRRSQAHEADRTEVGGPRG